MRSFLSSCLVFLALIGCVAASGAYLHRRTTEMSELAQALPESPYDSEEKISETLEELRLIWNSYQIKILLTVPSSRTDKIERALNNLEAGWNSKNEALYRSARTELLLSLKKLHEAEDFSLTGII